MTVYEYIRVEMSDAEQLIRLGWKLIAAEGYADGSQSSALLMREVNDDAQATN